MIISWVLGILLLGGGAAFGLYALYADFQRQRANREILDRVERLLKRGELDLAEEILRSTLH